MLTKQFKTVEGFAWAVIGAVICFFAYRIRLGSFHEPGPGFVAFAAGLFIAIVGLIMALSELLSKVSPDGSLDAAVSFRAVPWTRLGTTMGLLFGYAALLGVLGFILTTFLLMWGLLYDREKNNYVLSFLASLVIVGCSYLVFDVWLQCQLPRGILPWW